LTTPKRERDGWPEAGRRLRISAHWSCAWRGACQRSYSCSACRRRQARRILVL